LDALVSAGAFFFVCLAPLTCASQRRGLRRDRNPHLDLSAIDPLAVQAGRRLAYPATGWARLRNKSRVPPGAWARRGLRRAPESQKSQTYPKGIPPIFSREPSEQTHQGIVQEKTADFCGVEPSEQCEQ